MNEKLNIQDLIDLLAERHDMSRKNADSFVKEFFLLIEESLKKDKYVKIKGLGTFKLIDVENRESVNVNTGERFEIQGHAKVSFTPEPTLKEIINRPFSHFETVALNDNAVFEDTPLENGNEEEEDAMFPEQEQPREPVGVETEIDVAKTEKYLNEKVSDDSRSEVKEVAMEDASTMRYFIGIVVFVVLLCSGAVAFMYYPDLFDQPTSKPPVEEVAEAKKNEPVDETVLTDTIVENDTEAIRMDTVAESLIAAAKPKATPKEAVSQPMPAKEQKQTAATPVEPDSVGYTIVGTETTYTIQAGESLTKVALRFYGTKTLWPYIVQHNPNVIKNPNNVPFGTTIKIPKLVKKQ